MARKSLGFVPLIWQCPYCETKNPGPIKSCTSCGAPQPEDVEFLRVDEDEFNFIKDEALIRMAKAGPDIHCPYCGTRNPATAELCSKCGGELSVGGKARQTGQRVRAVGETQEPPPAPVPEPKKKRSRLFSVFAIIALLAVIAGCIVAAMLLLRTDDVTASVEGVEWERRIAIQEYTTVTESDWRDEIPAGADLQSCTQEHRTTSDQPQPNATEVCGEEYVEDTGTGLGEVVQDCVYEVYDDYCDYTVMDWVVVETVTDSGQNLQPSWPDPTLSGDQRLGQREETYTIVFSGDGETYTYTTSDEGLFMMAEPGSRWELSVNTFGAVQSIEPAN